MLASFLGALLTTVLFITVVLPELFTAELLFLYEFPFLEEVPLTLEPEDDLGVAVVTELLDELPARTELPELLLPDELLNVEDVELFEDLTLVPALFEELLPPRP
jgi:hypothetical protein